MAQQEHKISLLLSDLWCVCNLESEQGKKWVIHFRLKLCVKLVNLTNMYIVHLSTVSSLLQLLHVLPSSGIIPGTAQCLQRHVVSRHSHVHLSFFREQSIDQPCQGWSDILQNLAATIQVQSNQYILKVVLFLSSTPNKNPSFLLLKITKSRFDMSDKFSMLKVFY